MGKFGYCYQVSKEQRIYSENSWVCHGTSNVYGSQGTVEQKWEERIATVSDSTTIDDLLEILQNCTDF